MESQTQSKTSQDEIRKSSSPFGIDRSHYHLTEEQIEELLRDKREGIEWCKKHPIFKH